MSSANLTRSKSPGTTCSVTLRFAGPILGGFAFAYGFVAIFTLASFAAGLRFFEAHLLAWMLSFLVYLGAIMWGFAVRSVARTWLVLGGGGVAMMASAWAVSRAMM